MTIAISVGLVGVELWLVGAGAHMQVHTQVDRQTIRPRPLQQERQPRALAGVPDARDARVSDWADSVAIPPWIAGGDPSSTHETAWSGRPYVPLGQTSPAPLLGPTEQPVDAMSDLANVRTVAVSPTAGRSLDGPTDGSWTSPALTLPPYLIRSTGGHNVIITVLTRLPAPSGARPGDATTGAGATPSHDEEIPFAIGRHLAVLGACDQRLTVTGIQASRGEMTTPHVAVAALGGSAAPAWRVALAVPADRCERGVERGIMASIASPQDATALADALRHSPLVSQTGAPIFTPHELTAFYTTANDSTRFVWAVFRHRPTTTQLFPVPPAPVLTVLARTQRLASPPVDGANTNGDTDVWTIVWAMLDTVGRTPKPILGVYDLTGTGRPQAFVFDVAHGTDGVTASPIGDAGSIGDVLEIGQDSSGRWKSVARWTP